MFSRFNSSFGSSLSTVTKIKSGDTQSTIQGNVEELQRHFMDNEHKLKTKENELQRSKQQIHHLQDQLHRLELSNATMLQKLTEEEKAREKVVERMSSIQKTYSFVVAQSKSLATSFMLTEETCGAAVAKNDEQNLIICNLKEKISNIENAFQICRNDFEDQLSAKKAELSSCQTNFDNCLNELSAQLDEQVALVDSKKQEITDLENRICQIIEEKTKLQSQNGDLQCLIDKLTETKNSIEEELSKQLSKTEELNGVISKITSDFDQLQVEYESKSDELCVKSRAYDDIYGRFDETKAHLKDMTVQFDTKSQEFEKACSEWNLRLTEFSTIEEQYKKHIAGNEKQLTEANQELLKIPILEDRCSKSEQLSKELTSELDELKTAVGTLKVTLTDRECQLKTLTEKSEQNSALFKEELEAVEKRAKGLENKMLSANSEVELKNSCIDSLKEELDNQIEKTKNQDAEIDNKISKIEQLKKDIDKYNKNLGIVKKEKSLLLVTVEQHEKSLAVVKNEKNNFKSLLDEKTHVIEELNDRIVKMSEQLERASASISKGEHDWLTKETYLDDKIKVLISEIDDMKRENSSLLAAASLDQQSSAQIRAELQLAEKSRHRAEEEFKNQNIQTDALKREMKHLSDSYESQIKDLQQKYKLELAEKADTLRNQEDEIAHIREKLIEKTAENDRKNEDYLKLEMELAELKASQLICPDSAKKRTESTPRGILKKSSRGPQKTSDLQSKSPAPVVLTGTRTPNINKARIAHQASKLSVQIDEYEESEEWKTDSDSDSTYVPNAPAKKARKKSPAASKRSPAVLNKKVTPAFVTKDQPPSVSRKLTNATNRTSIVNEKNSKNKRKSSKNNGRPIFLDSTAPELAEIPKPKVNFLITEPSGDLFDFLDD